MRSARFLAVRFWLTIISGIGRAALTGLRRLRLRRAVGAGLIAGLAVALAAPAAIESSHEKRAAQDLASLSWTLKAIYRDVLPRDPWGNPYKYEVTGDGFRIISAGPDGKFNTRDDLVEHVTLFRK